MNGRIVSDVALDGAAVERDIELPDLAGQPVLEIEIQTGALDVPGDPRALGIALKSLVLSSK